MNVKHNEMSTLSEWKAEKGSSGTLWRMEQRHHFSGFWRRSSENGAKAEQGSRIPFFMALSLKLAM